MVEEYHCVYLELCSTALARIVANHLIQPQNVEDESENPCESSKMHIKMER